MSRIEWKGFTRAYLFCQPPAENFHNLNTCPSFLKSHGCIHDLLIHLLTSPASYHQSSEHKLSYHPNNSAAPSHNDVSHFTEKSCLAFLSQPKGSTKVDWSQDSEKFSHFPFWTHHKKEDGDPLPLLSGCCRRSLFPEKGFPIL